MRNSIIIRLSVLLLVFGLINCGEGQNRRGRISIGTDKGSNEKKDVSDGKALGKHVENYLKPISKNSMNSAIEKYFSEGDLVRITDVKGKQNLARVLVAVEDLNGSLKAYADKSLKTESDSQVSSIGKLADDVSSIEAVVNTGNLDLDTDQKIDTSGEQSIVVEVTKSNDDNKKIAVEASLKAKDDAVISFADLMTKILEKDTERADKESKKGEAIKVEGTASNDLSVEYEVSVKNSPLRIKIIKTISQKSGTGDALKAVQKESYLLIYSDK